MTIKPIDINDEMRQSYLDYAMSVIVSRALPDARDGLKPVQRRILYAMHEMGLKPKTPHRKSARVVGEVLGKYHPHGDSAVYETMVRMAQDFSLRYPMVDGQGNFGSIDGDKAAAMRYTEARMEPIGADMLVDLEKETVDFVPNFDDAETEPTVLPATIPSLLVNGSYGIAVGMSTSVPPHNLREISDALFYMLDNWETIDKITIKRLMRYVKAPDFPTGGIIFRYQDEKDELEQAYSTGRGRITVRGKIGIENIERGKSRLIITELPYQVNKTGFMKRIADLHKDGKVEGLTDLRDESDRNGMRILVEAKRNVDPQQLLKQLYKLTPLESTYSIIMVALVNGEPQTLTLKKALRVYIEHRMEVIKRRSEYDLRKAEERAHILEGLIIALDNLDMVISTIRKSKTTDTARQNLIKKLKMSDIQTKAVLEMPLRRLVSLEQSKIKEEHRELAKLIKHLKKLLKSEKLMRNVVREELAQAREKYGDKRQSEVVDSKPSDVMTSDDLIINEDVWFTVGMNGMVGRSKKLKTPSKPKSPPMLISQAKTRDYVVMVGASGEAVCQRMNDVLEASEVGRGRHWTNGYSLVNSARMGGAVIIPENAIEKGSGYITLATKHGSVKRVRVSDLSPSSPNSFTIIQLKGSDTVIGAEYTSGKHQILLATSSGKLIRFSENDVRASGMMAGGIAGVKLQGKGDKVVSLQSIQESKSMDKLIVVSVTVNGLAKSTLLGEYPKQGRSGKGVVNVKIPTKSKNDRVASITLATSLTTKLHFTTSDTIKTKMVSDIPLGIRSVTPKPLLPKSTVSVIADIESST